ncbi:hypothetical protein C8R44DRAFT_867146 [Mycena epipterygia]|nr:hypothetical protein C8R44DRAFT_867146 [Mycena epipterygia]
MAQVNTALKGAIIEEWGKVRRIDSDEGDTMRSCSLGTVAEDARDATYVRYEMLVDKNARRKKAAPTLELQTVYDDPVLQDLDIHFYSRLGGLDVIDITSVQSLIGRVEAASGEWGIIDHSGSLARAVWAGDQLVQ